MSLIITRSPEPFSPVVEDGLFFVVSANTTNEFKFRYIYEVYVEGDLIFTGKATANPYGLGIVDLTRLLENYCQNNPISLWNTTPIYTHETFPFSRPIQDEVINYYVKFGYEYADSAIGQVSGFTGNGDIVGDPAVQSDTLKTFSSTMGVNGSATLQDFDSGRFVLSGTPSGIDPTTSGLFLTNSPRYRDIQPSEYYTLSFTNYFLDTNPSYLSEPYYVEYKFFDNQGLLITATTYDNITTNGGGPRTTCDPVYQSWSGITDIQNTDYNVMNVGAGPMNIPYFPDNCAQYTVQLFGRFTGTTSPLSPTPTPTPSSPPSCDTCTGYTISATSVTVYFQYTPCSTSSPVVIQVIPGTPVTFCACVGSLLQVGKGDYDISTGPCPTPTPTPTPSASACNCISVELLNTGETVASITYTVCGGGSVTFSLPSNELTLVCACGAFMVPSEVVYTELGSCGGGGATPTPTLTSTPTPTPSLVTYTYLGRSTPDAADGPTACSTYSTVRGYVGLKPLASLIAGDYLYDTYPSSPTNGGSQWVALKVGGAGAGYAFQVATDGEILDTYTC